MPGQNTEFTDTETLRREKTRHDARQPIDLPACAGLPDSWANRSSHTRPVLGMCWISSRHAETTCRDAIKDRWVNIDYRFLSHIQPKALNRALFDGKFIPHIYSTDMRVLLCGAAYLSGHLVLRAQSCLRTDCTWRTAIAQSPHMFPLSHHISHLP